MSKKRKYTQHERMEAMFYVYGPPKLGPTETGQLLDINHETVSGWAYEWRQSKKGLRKPGTWTAKALSKVANSGGWKSWAKKNLKTIWGGHDSKLGGSPLEPTKSSPSRIDGRLVTLPANVVDQLLEGMSKDDLIALVKTTFGRQED